MKTSLSLRHLFKHGLAALAIALFLPAPSTQAAFAPTAFHSADTDGNYRFSLFELTRVIELFNTRYGTTRTGCYRVSAEGEDGFAPEPNRAPGISATLERYHSADTNHDGRLNLFELTRCIELFNVRVGSVRTGEYRVQALTEDGFAPGSGAPGPAAIWHDVTGDGILDEIISAGDPRFQLLLNIEDSAWDEGDLSWSLGFSAAEGNIYPYFTWSLETLYIPPSNNPWSTMDRVFAPEPGQEYILWWDDVYAWNNQIHLWPAAAISAQPRWSSNDLESGSLTLTVPSPRTFLSALAQMSWYLIRVGTVADEHPAATYSAHTHTREDGNPYVFGYLPSGELLSRTEMHAKVGELRNRPLNIEEIAHLDETGCIGLARLVMKRGSGGKLSGVPATKWPEEVTLKGGSRSPWLIRAFTTLEQTDQMECPPGYRSELFAKWGDWKNGVAPTPSTIGEVPVDSVWGADTPNHNRIFNYIVLINGKWIGINQAHSESAPQWGVVYSSPPTPNFPDLPLIFIKVCVPE
jgi:hypothetical protein